VYAIGKQHNVAAWRDLVRALLHQGLVQETQDGYPVLSLNALSWEVLRGERKVHIAAPASPPRRSKPDASAADSGAEDTPAEQALFERLHSLRKKLADHSGVPPYVIFHDATLREMVRRAPASLEEFAAIPGVGQAKLARYGQMFTDEIRAGRSREAAD
jgi:ATP-dependent DNA helicase RecQ